MAYHTVPIKYIQGSPFFEKKFLELFFFCGPFSKITCYISELRCILTIALVTCFVTTYKLYCDCVVPYKA